MVCYINSTAALKEYSDVCVTSANAVKIVKALPNKNIYFIPDRNLAHFVADQVPEKHFIYNEGFCPTHERMEADEVREAKEEHPDALVLSHPECNTEVLKLSDYIEVLQELLNMQRKVHVMNLSSVQKRVYTINSFRIIRINIFTIRRLFRYVRT